MADMYELIRGYRPNGPSGTYFEYGFSEAAKNYHSISFLDTYEEFKMKSDNINDLEFTFMQHPTYDDKDITVQEYNTWDQFCMIPDSAPTVQPSQVTPTYSDLVAWDGSIDETQVLKNNNDGMYYQMISGNWDFVLDTQRYLYQYGSFFKWCTNMLEGIHGRVKVININQNKDKIYIGRLFVEDVNDPGDGNPVTVSISYNIQPYVYNGSESAMVTYYNNGSLTKYFP